MKKICDLAHCRESVLGIILQSMQQQLNGVDCGVPANVFAVTDIGKRFDVRKMRSHLLKCFEEEFTLFLKSLKHIKLLKG